jgi:Ca2+-transporting ATPase
MAVAAGALAPQPALRVLDAPASGWVRLAMAGLRGDAERARQVEAALGAVAGVCLVRASAETGVVLVLLDLARCSTADLVEAAAPLATAPGAAPPEIPPGTLTIRSATPGRLRVAVQGLARQPEREATVVDALASVAGVRLVTASALTGGALVHYDPDGSTPESLLAALQRAVQDALQAAEPAVPALPRAERANGHRPAVARRAGPTLLDAAAEEPAWHALAADAVLDRLGVRPTRGLSADEARARLQRDGPNRLAEPPEPPLLSLVAQQFLNAPAILLGAGTVLSLATGALVEAALIAGVLAVNAVIGTVTERSGQRAIRALRRGMAIRARVRRDGEETILDADALVPGDLMLLRPGDPVPVDARIVSAERLRVEESALTGESRPVEKGLSPCPEGTPLADRANMVYRGTTVVGGHGAAVAVATGARTAYGVLRTLAASAEAPETPLERDLDRLGRTLAVGATAICGAVLGLSLLRGLGLVPSISTAVGLGVAAIPEALPTIATTVLALGSGRMRRRGTLIRTLSAAEALGSVTHVCADKTGTLTENRMAAREMYVDGRTVALDGPALRAEGAFLVEGRRLAPDASPTLMEALRVGTICSDAEVVEVVRGEVRLDGSATEGALLVAALQAGVDVGALRAAHPRIDARDRGDGRRYMLTIHHRDGRVMALVKGSPEEVLALCDRVAADDGTAPLSDARRLQIESRNADMAGRAMRVLGLAARELPDPFAEADLRAGFVWYGLIGLADPVRPQARAAIAALHRAGIRTLMITGDQAMTAVAVARELGLSRRGVLNTLEAGDLQQVDHETMRGLVREVGIFARFPPEMKLAVVRALQANGKIVAMTGDGVNDAPALRAADVGVAMGERGTELARELADVVLSTDDFRQMVAAVEEGRLVRANVQRVLHYLLGSNAAEVWTVLAAVAAGLPAPLNPLQLLWLNLVTDLAPALALAVEPRDPTLMRQPPRDPAESIVSRPFLVRLLGESGVIALAGLAVYRLGLRRHGPGPAAQTMAFGSLVSAQLLHALLARVGSRPATLAGGRPNWWLGVALGVSAGLQAAALFFPPLRRALGGAPLGLSDLLALVAGPVLAAGAIEGERLVRYALTPRTAVPPFALEGASAPREE